MFVCVFLNADRSGEQSAEVGPERAEAEVQREAHQEAL